MSLPHEKLLIAGSIAKRLRDIPRHRAALDVAMSGFGPGFDRTAFIAASGSSDPSQLVRAYAVQAGFENIQNHVTGLAREGLELVGELAVDERPNAARDLRRLQRLGGITAVRCERLIAIQQLRSSIQHEYANTAPADLHEAVELLAHEIGSFVDEYSRWLKAVVPSLGTSGAYPSPS